MSVCESSGKSSVVNSAKRETRRKSVTCTRPSEQMRTRERSLRSEWSIMAIVKRTSGDQISWNSAKMQDWFPKASAGQLSLYCQSN